MIGIKGGVVSIGRDDKLVDLEVTDAIVVLDMESLKDVEVVHQWILERAEGSLTMERCKFMTGMEYANHIMAKLAEKTKKPKRKIMFTRVFYITVWFLLMVATIVPVLRPAAPLIALCGVGALLGELAGMAVKAWRKTKDK